ncbi:hypothetical protein [Streptomyces sp. UNOC14_S4]|uniref:hypothetical protein n=1 Tax=Streptomyces sp. UNOC14_S4 TaxID=2872340 RepID=UPI001E3C95AE|nr:hypothetical protein [Streptomyces sp. UNOC14_S4]MCC3770392.1 hypothetical protein [Streptomyces sp. UNOC14_S4]
MEKTPELQAISNASDSELMLICAAAAERGMAFCRVLGGTESIEWADEALELAWAAAAGEFNESECADALDGLEMDSGDDEDDSSSPEFFIAQSLALIGNALSASLRPTAAKAELSVNTMRSLLSMLDFKLAGEHPVIVRYGEGVPPPGVLQQMEIDAERELADLLARRDKGDGQRSNIASALPQVEASSREFSAQLATSIEEVADLSDWEL